MKHEYYAVERTGSSLQHYGVKGMKWGVRKALQTGGYRGRIKLAKQYVKAAKKLAKLNRQADIDVQKKEVGKHARRAIAGVGLPVWQLPGTKIDTAANIAGLTTSKKNARRKKIVGEAKPGSLNTHGQGLTSEVLGGYQMQTQVHHPAFGPSASNQYQVAKPSTTTYHKPTSKPAVKKKGLTGSQLLSIGLTAGGLGTAAYQTGKAIASKYRTTAKGHAKAVAKRDAWKKSMQEAFKGTQYDASGSVRKNRKRRR